jgi:hypothetical protein
MTSLRSFVSRTRAFPISLAVLGFGLAAGCGGSGTSNVTTGDGGIQAPVSIDPPMHTFGDVLVGQSSEPKMFTVRNTGASSLSSIMATAGGIAAGQFVVTGSCSGALGRNATCLVSVVFRPTSAGDKNATLDILAGGGKRSAMLSGRASSPARVTAAQMDLTFGSVAVGDTSDPKPLTITNEGSLDAGGLEIRVSGEFEKGMGACPAMLKAGESCMQPIVFKPTSVGAKMGTVTISMSGTGAQPVTIQLLGTGVARPAVAVSPGSLEFDPVGVGRVGPTSAVTVRNASESPVEGFTATIASMDFRVTNGCPGTIVPGGSCMVMVAFTPRSMGAKRAELALAVTGGDPVGVPLSGRAVSPARLVLSPTLPADRPSFVPVTVGSPSPELTLTVTNEGEEQIDQLKLESSDPRFVIRHTCGTRLLPNAACSFGVVFTPAAEGTAMATIKVSGSVGATALTPAETTVSGIGVRRPTITITPAERDFGTGTVGQSSEPTSFTIANTGGAPTGTLRVTTQVGDFRIVPGTDSCNDRSLPAGGSCAVSVLFAPTSAGQKSSPLTALSDQAGSTGAMLRGRGVVGAQLALDRTAASFGTVGLGQTSSEVIVTVTNRGDVESGVVQLSTGSSQFVIGSNGCQNNTLTPGESCSASVRFTAANVGDFATNLTASATPGGSITAALTATGVAPATIAFQQANGTNLTVLSLGGDVGSQSVATVFLRNTGMISSGMLATAIEGPNSGDFIIVEGSNSCGAPLPPGGQCSMTIAFRPTAAGARSATVNVRAGAGGVASLLLQGSARGQLEILSQGVAVTSFTFPDRAAGLVSEDQEFVLSARAPTGTFTIAFDGGGSPPSFARAGGTCETTSMLPMDGTCTLRVRFQPQSVGPKTGSLRVTTSDGVTATLALAGTGTGPLQLSPRPHNFGDREAGSTTELPFVLTNSGPHPMTAVAVTLMGSSDFVVSADTCATAPPAGNGGTCTVTVRFVPTTPGAKTATLSARGSFMAAGASQSDTATTAISGNATAAAQIAVAPAEHDFGSVAVASGGATHTFRVSNGSDRPTTGGILLDTENERFTDDFAVTRNGCLLADNTSPRPLAAGESCTFDVRFTPTATGLRPGILRVFGNPGGSVDVRLSGTGLSTLIIEPGAQDFDAGGALNVVGQTNGRRELVITNRGAAALALAIALEATDVIGATADGVTYFQLHPSTMAGAVCPTALAGGASCRVEVAMVTPAGGTPGKKYARLQARSAPTAATATAVSELSGTLRADAALAYVDGSAPREFGGVKVNEVSGTHLVQVQNRGAVGSGPLTVTIPANFESTIASGTNPATGNPVCVTGEPLAANAICDIVLRFRPNTALGTLPGVLRVSASGFGAVSGNQDKALSGVGLPVGGIYLAPTPSDFGTAAPGVAAPVERTLTLTNDTGVAVAVAADGVTVTGAGFSVSAQTCAPSIAPAGTCTVTTRFQPDQAAAAGTVTGTLQVVGTPAGAGPLNASAAIQGRVVVPALRIEAAAEGPSWGESLVGTAAAGRVFTIRNIGGAPTASAPVINVTGAQATDFALPPESNGCSAALAPNGACTVTIVLTPAAVAARSANLNASAGPAVASLPLTANGVLPSAIQVVSIGGTAGAATTVEFGNKAVGSETGIDVVIKNADSGQRIAGPTFTLGDTVNFRVDTNAGAPGDCFDRAQDGLQGGPPGESCTVRIFFRPQSLPAVGSAAPNFSSTLIVGGAATPLTLTLRGHAVSALSITPDNRTFGSQAVNGTSSATTFTVANSGDLGIASTGQVAVTLIGADADSFRITRNECTGLTLARAGAGDSDCQVDVVFEPKSAGAKAATLSVTASPTNGATAALSGSGT